MSVAEATEVSKLVLNVLQCALFGAGIVAAVYLALVARLEYRARVPGPGKRGRVMGFAATRAVEGLRREAPSPTDTGTVAPPPPQR